MAIKGFTDIGAGHKALTVDHDPRAVATDAPKGSILVDANGEIYRKIDDGSTTNVVDMGLYSAHMIVIHPSDDMKVILEAASDGDSFHLAPGLHTITDKITIANKKNISIIGGPGARVTRSGSPSLFQIVGCEDFRMAGFTLTAAVANLTVIQINDAGAPPYKVPTRHSYVGLHFEITGGGDGVDGCISCVDPFVQGTIRDCTMVGAIESAITLFAGPGKSAEATIISNNRIVATIGGGVAITVSNQGGVGMSIEGNHIAGAFYAGIDVASTSRAVSVRGNTIRGATDFGILFGSGTDRAIISNNIVYDCGLVGMDLYCDYSVVQGNQIYSPGGEGIVLKGSKTQTSGNDVDNATLEGIRVEGDYNNISGNTVSNGSTSAVNIISGANYNRIQGNEFSANATGPIFDAGTGNVIDHGEFVISPGDDLEAILEAAIDGQSFFLAPGLHTTAGIITIANKKNISITGTPGARVTRSGSPQVFQINGCEDFHMEGFTITVAVANLPVLQINNAASAPYQYPTRHSYVGLHFEITGGADGVDGCISCVGSFIQGVVRDCTMVGAIESAITIYAGASESAEGTIIANNRITTTTGGGTAIGVSNRGNAGMMVEGNQIAGAFYIGIDVAQLSLGMSVRGNIIRDIVGGYGIGFATGCDRAIIAYNNIYSTTSSADGMDLLCDYSAIQGNQIYSPAGQGIVLKGLRNQVSGNNIDNATLEGIRVEGDYNNISGNTVTAGSTSAINIISGADYNRIHGNEFSGNTTGPILDAGTDNVIDCGELVISPDDDMSAIINAAVDGDAFFLAPGVHEITGAGMTITSKKNISIRGTKGAIVFHDSDVTIFKIEGCEDFRMEGFTIRTHLTISGVALVTVTNVGAGSYQRPTRHRYADLYFEQLDTGDCQGIDIQGDFLESVVEGCVFTGRFTSCILMGSESAGDDNSRSYVRNNICITTYSSSGSGIRARSDSGQGIFVINNFISGPFNIGIEGASDDDLIGLTISGNYIENVDGNAITVEHPGSAQDIVVDNIIWSPGGMGIYFRANKSTVSGNVIYDATLAGIQVTGDNNSITGNTITDGAMSGLDLIVGAENNVVEGNMFTGNSDGPILNGGVDNKIDGKVENSVSTTDATATTIAIVPMPDDASSLLEVSVTAFRTNGTDQAAYRSVSLSSRRSAGNCIIEGSEDLMIPIESDAAWIVSFAVSTTSILVQVQGAAAKDIEWKCRHTVESES